MTSEMASNLAEMWIAPIDLIEKIYLLYYKFPHNYSTYSEKQHKRKGPKTDISQSMVRGKHALESPGRFGQ